MITYFAACCHQSVCFIKSFFIAPGAPGFEKKACAQSTLQQFSRCENGGVKYMSKVWTLERCYENAIFWDTEISRQSFGLPSLRRGFSNMRYFDVHDLAFTAIWPFPAASSSDQSRNWPAHHDPPILHCILPRLQLEWHQEEWPHMDNTQNSRFQPRI